MHCLFFINIKHASKNVGVQFFHMEEFKTYLCFICITMSDTILSDFCLSTVCKKKKYYQWEGSTSISIPLMSIKWETLLSDQSFYMFLLFQNLHFKMSYGLDLVLCVVLLFLYKGLSKISVFVLQNPVLFTYLNMLCHENV